MKNYKWDHNKIWEKHFGSSVSTFDYAGRRIRKSEYNTPTEFAWSLDHIKPIAKGGTDSSRNLMPVHALTNLEKGDSFPKFKAFGGEFEVIEVSNDKVSDWQIKVIKRWSDN